MDNWIDIEDIRPEWGMKVIVFRGKILIPEAWKTDFPVLVELTNQFDDLITHWMPLNPPFVDWIEEQKKRNKSLK